MSPLFCLKQRLQTLNGQVSTRDEDLTGFSADVVSIDDKEDVTDGVRDQGARALVPAATELERVIDERLGPVGSCSLDGDRWGSRRDLIIQVVGYLEQRAD